MNANASVRKLLIFVTEQDPYMFWLFGMEHKVEIS